MTAGCVFRDLWRDELLGATAEESPDRGGEVLLPRLAARSPWPMRYTSPRLLPSSTRKTPLGQGQPEPRPPNTAKDNARETERRSIAF